MESLYHLWNVSGGWLAHPTNYMQGGDAVELGGVGMVSSSSATWSSNEIMYGIFSENARHTFDLGWDYHEGWVRAWEACVECLLTNALIIPWGYLSPVASLGRTNSPLQAVSIEKLSLNAPGHGTILILPSNGRMFWYQDLLVPLWVTCIVELQSWRQDPCTWHLENLKNLLLLLIPACYIMKRWRTGNQN